MALSRHLIAGAMIFATTALNPALADVRAGVEAWHKGNYTRAVAEWRPLAAQGDPDAQFNLAQAYKLGRGVPADLKLARSWYEKAAKQEHEEARANLGLIMFQEGEQQAGMVWIRMAADKGDPRARYVLATALFNGDTMARDRPRAYALMSRAAAQGLLAAGTSLGEMENFMPEAERQQGIKLARDLARTDAEEEAARIAPGPKEAPPSTEVASNGPRRAAAPQPAKDVPPAAPKPAPAPLALPMQVASSNGPPLVVPEVNSPPEQPKPVPFYPLMEAASLVPAKSPAAKPTRPSAPIVPDGRWRVQLGAYSNVELAREQWAMLSKKIDPLAGLKPSYEPFGALTRLRVNALSDRSAAQNLCAAARAAGQDCFAIAP